VSSGGSSFSVPRAKTPLEDFLLAEYQYLAQAHFNTINSISEFFKQYVLIVSLPISAAVVFLKPADLRASGILTYLDNYPSIPLALSMLVGAVGLGVLVYVANLRFDALLYARSVNGIRKSFYKASGISIEEELRVRVLPTSTAFPRYIENRFFLPVVLTFAGINTAYFFLGLRFYMNALLWPSYSVPLFWAATASWFLLHPLFYFWLGDYRENTYMRSHNIGIDIDGVLNEHRQHFCKLLDAQTGKKLNPDQIVQIPVHEILGCSITREDECAVFNWPPYWTEMPVTAEAVIVVNTLRNVFHYRIWIFSHRPWPQSSTIPESRMAEYQNEWRKYGGLAISDRLRNMTEEWLRTNGFKYDKLIIEKGNTDTRDPYGHTRNRFVISQKENIRIFVEDDLNKALKLADICELVFLKDHPYNQAPSLPNNVIRVSSWKEIERFLRRVS
jgi:uncharacterized HAD superfamily protein